MAPLGCTNVAGTPNVWVISRADPWVAAAPDQPPDPNLAAHRMAGPDALGRVYLLDDNYVLLRSDDDGCNWQPVWTFLENLELWTSPATERIYARVHVGGNQGLLWVSEDGGEYFGAVTDAVPGPLVGAQEDEARATTGTSLHGSSDGGQTWQPVVGFPTQALSPRTDLADIRRVAYISADNESELRLYDGTSWSSQVPDPGADLFVVSWKGDDLVLLSRREGGDTSLFLRSETGTAPFTETDWGQLENDEISDVATDGPRLVAAGRNDPPGSDYSQTQGFVVITDGSSRYRHEMPGFDDTLGIAVTETSIIVALRSTSYGGTW